VDVRAVSLRDDNPNMIAQGIERGPPTRLTA